MARSNQSAYEKLGVSKASVKYPDALAPGILVTELAYVLFERWGQIWVKTKLPGQ